MALVKSRALHAFHDAIANALGIDLKERHVTEIVIKLSVNEIAQVVVTEFCPGTSMTQISRVFELATFKEEGAEAQA